MRTLAALSASVLLLGLVTACGPRRNSEQVRIYEGCVFQLAQALSLRASVPSTGDEKDQEVAWGKLAQGEPATTLEQCECHADELYWMTKRDGKDAMLEFYENGNKEALADMTDVSRSAYETVCA
ncbi:MAG: hypothetical protein AAF559_12950 [Pseudomonadota bacterium]